MTTKLPSIPDYNGGNLKEVITALKEATEVRTGQRGDPMDAGATFRDLEALRLLVKTGTDDGSPDDAAPDDLSAPAPVRPPYYPGGPIYDPGSDLTVPPVPTGLTATAVMESVMLSWSVGGFANPSYWEVYRAFVNDLSQAVLVGTTTSQFFTDPIGVAGKTVYYWVRTVSAAGVYSGWNSTEGTAVTTGINPTSLLKQLEGQILESALARDLAEKINNAYDGIAAEASKRAADILAEAYARGAAIRNEQTIRQTADQSLASDITTLTASVASNAAAIQDEATARANADSAEASQRSTLATQIRGSYTGTNINSLSAGLLYDERVARSTADSAIASDVSNLSTTVGDHTTTLQTQAQSINGLSAQYTVKIDNNGYVSGFGLASDLVNGTPLSQFLVRANRFAFIDPNGYKNPVANLTLGTVTSRNVSALVNRSTVTITTLTPHDLTVGSSGMSVTISGVTSDTRWNTSYTVVSVPSATTLTVTATDRKFTNFTGSIVVATPSANGYNVSSIVPGTVYGVCTTSTSSGMSVGMPFTLSNVTSNTQWNATWVVASIINSTNFTFAINTSLPSPATSTGTMTVISDKLATLTTGADHNLAAGDTFNLSGATGTGNYNAWNSGWSVASVLSATQLTFRVPATITAVPTFTSAVISSAATPFVISDGKTVIKTALIANASITDAQIANLSASKITAGYANATIGFNGAKVYGASLYAGGTTTITYASDGITPINFTATNPTFKVEGSDVEVVAANFKIKTLATATTSTTVFEVKQDGTVGMTSAAIGTGTIGSANIANSIQSTTYSTTTGWQINQSGTAIFNNATIRGTLQSSDGLFVINLINKYISISV